MKLALDACVALKVVLPEPDSHLAHALMQDFHTQVHELIAPDTLPVEIAHAMTRAERQGILPAKDGFQRFQQLSAILPTLHDYKALLPRAYELSSQFRIGVFDCLYVALSEREQSKVVTVDKRLIQLFPSLTVGLDGL
jgi:predicted nucleic acid-binding protein